MERLFVYHNTGKCLFEGESARKVLEAIEEAGGRGADWTTPVSLIDGSKVVFVLANICFFEYK